VPLKKAIQHGKKLLKIIEKQLVIKVLIIALPTYAIAFLTGAMVYTMPMLAITTVIATSIFNDKSEKRVDTDFKDIKEDYD